MKVNSALFEAYLKCPTKCYLRSTGQAGAGNGYADWAREQNDCYRKESVQQLVTAAGDGVAPTTPGAENLKTATWQLAVDLPLETETMASRLQAVERVQSQGRGRPAQFIPVRFVFWNKLTKDDRLLVAFDALVLSEVLGREVSMGKIIHGDDHATLKIKVVSLLETVRKVTVKMSAMFCAGSPPDLILNRHCTECDFRDRCRQNAVEKDDLSLFPGMTEKERGKHRSRGIFTINQLSYTFRPRRTPKRTKNPSNPHHFALQALAIRENKVYIHGSPQVPIARTNVYLDIEGLPDGDFYYLIGGLFITTGHSQFYSFWAQDKTEEEHIFAQFVATLCQWPDFRLLHFGDYDGLALRKIMARLPKHLEPKAHEILSKLTNVLSIVHGHIYFPTHSNSLKDLGTYLGGQWTDQGATGLQTVIWRKTWEITKDPDLRTTLIQYNKDDCLNLKRLCHFIANTARFGPDKVINTQDIRKEGPRRCVFGTKDFTSDNFQFINKCAYFDYQREKIFFKNRQSKVASTLLNRRSRPRPVRPNTVVYDATERCPHCRSQSIEPGREMSYFQLDLRFSKGHVKKWVTEYSYWDYRCLNCHYDFNPVGAITHDKKYGVGLMSWCVYCNVLRGQNMLQVNKTLQDAFDISLDSAIPYRFKGYLAERFQEAYGEILAAILESPVLHIDETPVNLRNNLSGYVWVVTSMHMVYYFYKPSREGAFLNEMLAQFSGVLVSDFFSAYDSLGCGQQKCLVHLIRDMDEDLLRNPLDTELKSIVQEFGVLLRTIVETVDCYGLKKRHLHKHKRAVVRFLKGVGGYEFSSEVADKYKRRFQKSGAKMFTFLDHDGVPWNNANAEHAIKLFAKYRRNADGRFTAESLKEYLLLASVIETCEFSNVNALRFLLSGEKTLAGLLRLAGRRAKIPGTARDAIVGDGSSLSENPT